MTRETHHSPSLGSVLLIFLISLWVCLIAGQNTTTFGGHSYRNYDPYTLNATAAIAYAESSRYQNFRGYVLVIDSVDEENFIQSTFKAQYNSLLNGDILPLSQQFGYLSGNDSLYSTGSYWKYGNGPREGQIFSASSGSQCLSPYCKWSSGSAPVGPYYSFSVSDMKWVSSQPQDNRQVIVEFGGGVCAPYYSGPNCDQGLTIVILTELMS